MGTGGLYDKYKDLKTNKGYTEFIFRLTIFENQYKEGDLI
jgi:hypothetical protein